MKIYLDTNVLIDFLSNRGVFTKFATEIFSAVSIGMVDYIVTRNLKDFKHSLIPAVAPDELLSIIDPTK